MCGICGIFNFSDGKLVSKDRISSMCRTIYHRGPDDEGVFVRGPIGLGTRRLSIIDLEGGHQPLSNEDESVWAAHNGEVYNFPELKEELTAAGHVFRTRTDTETLVHSYEEWGSGFVHRLRGMLATAIWDGRNESLTIIRDRVGIKPLYYTLAGGKTLVFGSELKAVLKHPGVARTVNPRALDLFLTLEYIPAPHSIFAGIHKLPAGHRLICSREGLRIERYWNLETTASSPEKTGPKNLPAAMDELYSRLRESVRLRLVSDVPLGAFLSGGIDSSTIVGLMRELGASPLKTFSIGFEDKTYDELSHARRIARTFDTDHQEFIIQPQALSLTEKLITHLDEPLGDFSIFPTYLVSKMARKHVKVILSGDGGDEVFGGYEPYQAQKLSRLPFLAPGIKLFSPILRALPPSERKKGLWNKIQRYAQGFENPKDIRHFRWMMFFSRKDKEALYSKDFFASLGENVSIKDSAPFNRLFSSLDGYDSTNGELALDLQSYLVDDILVKVDRMSMAVSLETRVPLLDHKVIEFAFSLPGRLKLKGLTTKWLLKKTMERLLPHENIYRKKEGFSIPIKHWLRTDLKDLLCDTLTEARIREEGYFRYPAVKRMIDRHLAGKANYSHQLWALLVFAIWKDRYL